MPLKTFVDMALKSFTGDFLSAEGRSVIFGIELLLTGECNSSAILLFTVCG
jgi:hypothetical protein